LDEGQYSSLYLQIISFVAPSVIGLSFNKQLDSSGSGRFGPIHSSHKDELDKHLVPAVVDILVRNDSYEFDSLPEAPNSNIFCPVPAIGEASDDRGFLSNLVRLSKIDRDYPISISEISSCAALRPFFKID
jgi:hypothetical protein